MKAIGACINGLEEISIMEIKEISNLNSSVKIPGRVEIDYKNEDDLKKIVYAARSINRVYTLLKEFSFKDRNDFKKNIKDLKFKLKGKTFAVRCFRKGNHDFNSQWVEKEIGLLVNKKVDLENPNTLIYAEVIDDSCFIGIDLTGINLCKRDYRIRTVSDSINSCLAYCLVRLSGFEGKERLLDAFCKDGSIPIEAALFAMNIPNGFAIKEKLKFLKKIDFKKFDKAIKKHKTKIVCSDALMYNIKCSEINAQVAAVRKEIKFSRADIEWLETKFKKNEVDFIVSVLPSVSKVNKEDDVSKICAEFFYQAEYILKKKGVIVVAVRNKKILDKAARKYKFVSKKELNAKIGDESYEVVVYKKE